MKEGCGSNTWSIRSQKEIFKWTNIGSGCNKKGKGMWTELWEQRDKNP